MQPQGIAARLRVELMPPARASESSMMAWEAAEATEVPAPRQHGNSECYASYYASLARRRAFRLVPRQHGNAGGCLYSYIKSILVHQNLGRPPAPPSTSAICVPAVRAA